MHIGGLQVSENLIWLLLHVVCLKGRQKTVVSLTRPPRMPFPVCVVATRVLAAKSPKLLLGILTRRGSPISVLINALRQHEMRLQQTALGHICASDQVVSIVNLPKPC